MNSAGKNPSAIKNGRILGGFFTPPVILILIFLPINTSKIITWRPNLEWNTAGNWANNFVPQNGTHVVFPVEMRLSVGLPARNSHLDIAGIDLPLDGALALPETGYFTISEAGPTTKTASWSLEGPLLWVDPDNWDFEKSSRAVPHLERIPCQDDVVELPESKRTISIQLPDTMGTKVKAVRVKDDTGNLAPWEWTDQIEPQREFSSGPTSVRYSGLQSCLDCTCQPESIGRQIVQEVCKTRGGSCPALECESPVKVEGHCCFYCGGRVVLQSATSVSLAKTVANLALEKYRSSLSWYVRRTWDSKTEILIAGNEGYSAEGAIEGVKALESALKEQGIKVVSSEMTGSEIRISKWAAFFGIFFGTLVFAMALVLVAIPYFGYSLPQVLGESWRGFRELVDTSRTEVALQASSREPGSFHWKPFGFAKFENAPESEVELATSASTVPVVYPDVEDEDDDGEEGGGRFANPLYRSGRRQPEVQTFATLQRLHDEDAEVEEVDLAID